MAINTTMNSTTQSADYTSKQKEAQVRGKQTTDRGTLITRSNNELDSSSFLKIMIAEMKNMDPSSNTDNTQYVTQMAQLTTMQQMNDLNKTMSNYSYQALLGKGVTVNVNDAQGNPYSGIVKAVTKENGEFYLTVDVVENGQIAHKKFHSSTLVSVLGVSDNTGSSMLTNSDFIAASNLAGDKNNKVVILNTDDKGTQSIVKGTVKSTFVDNGIVKVRVATYDADGKESTTTTEYPYSYIVKAGDLTDKDMDVKLEDYVTTKSSSTTDTTDKSSPNYDPTKDPNSDQYDSSTAMSNLANGTTDVKASSNKIKDGTVSTDDIDEQLKKVQAAYNG